MPKVTSLSTNVCSLIIQTAKFIIQTPASVFWEFSNDSLTGSSGCDLLTDIYAISQPLWLDQVSKITADILNSMADKSTYLQLVTKKIFIIYLTMPHFLLRIWFRFMLPIYVSASWHSICFYMYRCSLHGIVSICGYTYLLVSKLQIVSVCVHPTIHYICLCCKCQCRWTVKYVFFLSGLSENWKQSSFICCFTCHLMICFASDISCFLYVQIGCDMLMQNSHHSLLWPSFGQQCKLASCRLPYEQRPFVNLKLNVVRNVSQGAMYR